MSHTHRAHRRRSRVLAEDLGTDFPFYPGSPSSLSLTKWAVIITSLVFTYILMDRIYPVDTIGLYMWKFLPTILPLGILAMVTSEHWKKLFRPVGRREFWLMYMTAMYATIAGGACGIIIKFISGIGDEPQSDFAEHPIETKVTAPEASNWLPVQIALKFVLYLMWEELYVILPFLAIFAVLIKFGASRIWAITIGLVVSSLFFGWMHLDTYSGDLAICFAILPVGRVVMTYAYIKTKNLWVTTGAHIMFDLWALFIMLVDIKSLF